MPPFVAIEIQHLQAHTSSLDRLAPIFTGQVQDTAGQSNICFILLPLTQRLMSS